MWYDAFAGDHSEARKALGPGDEACLMRVSAARVRFSAVTVEEVTARTIVADGARYNRKSGGLTGQKRRKSRRSSVHLYPMTDAIRVVVEAQE